MPVFPRRIRSGVSPDRLPGVEGNGNVSLQGFTNNALDLIECESDENETKETPKAKHAPVLPINKVGIFSYTFLTWFSPLIWRMYKLRVEGVEQDSIWSCSEEEGVEYNTKRLKDLWEFEIKENEKDKASFYRVWMKFIWRRTLVALTLTSLFCVTIFLQSAFLLKLTLAYLEDPADDLKYGIGLVVAVLVCQLIRTCSYNASTVYAYQTGTRFRAGMNGLLYDKVLKLKSLNGKSSEILNTFSIDSYRVFVLTYAIIYILVVSICVAVGIVYCYVLIGYWVLVTLGSFAALILFQMSMSNCLKNLRKRCVRFTDTRIKFMSEILNSMKFIKLYAWEEPFKSAVKRERRREQHFLLFSGILQGIIMSVIPVAPTIVSVITIAVYTAFGNDLSVSTAFAFIGTTNFMRMITSFISFAARIYGEGSVSLNRIKNILLMEEYAEPSNCCILKTNAIEFVGAAFSWDSEHNSKSENISRGEIILEDITLNVQKNQIIGICGAVGSGKSSMLSAILGRMYQIKGHLAVDGKIAYSAQQAWVFNGSVRNNILFGLEYNEHRYKEVIRCCGLEPDLQRFDFGDETEIGERGITLSGGQKQRVNLARATYSNSDIYLLDDPLSALDTTVGKQVFHDCIKGLLKDKTVVLVTHQLQYMSHCDEVIVLEKGRIVEGGVHKDLVNRGGLYTEMFKTYENTTATSDQNNVKFRFAYNKVHSPNNVEITEYTTNKKEKGKLVLAEEAAVGTVTFKTYNAYIGAGGGWFVAALVVAVYFLAAGSLVFSEWWLSRWLESGYLSGSTNETDVLHNVSDASIGMATANAQKGGIFSALDEDIFFLVYVVSFLGALGLQLLKGSIGAKVCITAARQLHTKCLNSVMKAPLSFFESNPTGRILNRFTKDLDEGDVYIPEHINSGLQTLCLVILTLGVSSYITPWILIVIVPFVIAVYFIKQVVATSMRHIKRLENVSRSPLISHVNLTLQGLPSITAYGQQDAFFKKCVDYGSLSSMMSMLFEVSARWISVRIDLLAGCLNVVAYFIFVLKKGVIPASSAGLVLSLLGKTVNIIDLLVVQLNQLEAKFTSVERIHEYSKLLQEPQQGLTPALSNWPTRGAIEFRDVVMRYRPNLDPVLKSVSFVIGPREKVGVVGRTGAGKSSLAVCLFRLVEPSAGTISVDDQDVSKLSLSCLRSRISSIPQDPTLFNGTIRYNIDPFAMYSDEDIWTALERVKMKQTILQSDGKLDSKVEENGGNFSVGERQLICLARAVLRDNKKDVLAACTSCDLSLFKSNRRMILVLDEATANIDTSTDAMIQETIRTCFVDCTVITIAHRLSTVLQSDKIIVMEAGQIVESAQPESLLEDPASHLNKMLAAQTLEN